MSSFTDCLEQNLPKGIFKDVQEQYDIMLRNAGGDESKADVMLADWIPTFQDNFKRARLGNVMATIRLNDMIDVQLNRMADNWDALSPAAKGWAKLVNSNVQPTRAYATEVVYQNADVNARAQANYALGELQHTYDKITAKGMQLDADRSLMDEVMTGLIDGVDMVKNAEVRKIVNEQRRVMDDVVTRYKQAGGQMGKVENYVPIKHNAAKIGNVGFEKWYGAYREMTDISKVTDFKTGKLVDERRFKEIANDMYQDIISDGSSRAARQLKNTRKVIKFKNPDMFSRRMQARLSSPKNAKAFKRYNEEYGVGADGMYDLIVSNIEGIARDTGVMQIMGPMPYAQSDQLAKLVKSSGGDPADVKRTEALFRTLVGHWEGSVDTTLSKFATGMQNVVSASLLGSASLAAIGDRVFIKNTIRLNGLVGSEELGTFLNSMVGNTDELLRALHTAEAMSHTSVSRFDGEINNTNFGGVNNALNNLKNLNHRISGLQRITLATGDALSLSFFATLGSNVQKKVGWDSLNKDFRNLLATAGVDSRDWNQLLVNGVDERGFVTPLGLPDELSDVARKLNGADLQLRTFATNSPDLRQRMYTTGNRLGAQVRGDYGNVLSSAILQFKSFPMMVWRNHFVPNMTRALNGDAAPMAMMLGGAMFYGALIVQLKELIKGNELRPWDHELWMKAFVQAGAGGLIGDALFKDPDAYGRSLVEELAGPTASSLGAATLAASAMGWSAAFGEDEDNFDWGAVTRASKPFLPLGTVWYARAAVDHMFWDVLTGALDEDYYANAQRRNIESVKERGGAGWWKKGAVLPQF